MNQHATGVAQVLDKLALWANTQVDVRAVIVIGSQARSDHPADEWSDIDVLVLTRNPEDLLEDTGWLEHIGRPRITFLEKRKHGDGMERRVLFQEGLDMDIVPLPVELAMSVAAEGMPSEAEDIFRRGVKFVVDKDGFEAILSKVSSAQSPATPPTEPEYDQVVKDFWYHAVWGMKKFRRGELWTAKACCDVYMKRRLLEMIEWQARASRGWNYDTWHTGRFIEEWANPRALKELGSAFARYAEKEISQAYIATMDLFHWLATEVADRLHYAYPQDGEQYARELIDTYLKEYRTNQSSPPNQSN
jgi:aminoglycoside 6-adenylyltransferase